MRLSHRIERLERIAGRPGDVTWQQYFAAHQHAEAAVVSKLEAVIDGREPPQTDPEQTRFDEQLARRWARQQGFSFDLACAQAINEFERRIAILGSEG